MCPLRGSVVTLTISDTALRGDRNSATKERMDAAGMTLEDAGLFAEFEDDPAAIDTLTAAWDDAWRHRQLPHIVHRSRRGGDLR